MAKRDNNKIDAVTRTKSFEVMHFVTVRLQTHKCISLRYLDTNGSLLSPTCCALCWGFRMKFFLQIWKPINCDEKIKCTHAFIHTQLGKQMNTQDLNLTLLMIDSQDQTQMPVLALPDWEKKKTMLQDFFGLIWGHKHIFEILKFGTHFLYLFSGERIMKADTVNLPHMQNDCERVLMLQRYLMSMLSTVFKS